MESVDDLVDAALKAAGPTPSLDDIEKAVAIAKSAADIAKTQLDTKNATAQLQLERLKTWPTLLIPIVSILTLLATIWIQADQLQATRQQNEDTQWRDFLTYARVSPNRIISDVTFAPRLKSFLHSPIYGSQVLELAKRLMGNVVSQGGFDDLLDLVFPDRSAINLKDLVDISKALNRTKLVNINLCYSVSQKFKLPPEAGQIGICTTNIKEEDAVNYVKDAPNATDVLQLRHDMATIQNEQMEISGLLANALRKNPPKVQINMSGAYVADTDLSNIDFSGADLSDVQLDTNDLAGSKLTPRRFDALSVVGSNWWDASEVTPKLLDYLITYWFPGNFPGEVIAKHGSLDRDYYVGRIAQLCRPKRDICDPAKLRFEPGFGLYAVGGGEQ